MRHIFALLLAALTASAQDSGLVLRTYVNYNQTAATLQLPPEKKSEVQKLSQQAMLAYAQGNYGDALKLLHKGTALMGGIEWTPAVSLVSALSPSLDHALWEPGQAVVLRMKRLYRPAAGAPDKLPAKLTARPIGGGAGVALGELTGDEATIRVPELPPRPYRLEVKFEELPQPKFVDVAVAPGVRARGRSLQARIAKLQVQEGTALWTGRYLASLPERVDRSEIGPAVRFESELAQAEEIIGGLEIGKDVLAGRAGDTHRAYLSALDKTLQPYRVYVPSSWQQDTPTALVIALHGMGGDENTLFDRYGRRGLQDAADKHGWIVAAPKGRESASMYRGPAEQDVLDVLAEIRRSYNIDESRIYLTGHSMGGYGTWSVAQNHPEVFASLGPVAGGGSPARMDKIRHIPQIVVHGDNDKTVPVSSSRSMVEAARKLGTEMEYVEIAGGGHNDVFMPSVPRIFEFFAAHSKKAAKAVSTTQ